MSPMQPPVEARYTLTVDDWAAGYDAHARATRLLFRIRSVLGWVLVVCAAVLIPAGRYWLVVVAAVVGLAQLVPGRLFVRPMAAQLVKDNPHMGQPMRITVSDGGLDFDMQGTQTHADWSLLRNYLETDRAFVVMTSKGWRGSIQLVPKRALEGDAEDRLRTLLSTHLESLDDGRRKNAVARRA